MTDLADIIDQHADEQAQAQGDDHDTDDTTVRFPDSPTNHHCPECTTAFDYATWTETHAEGDPWRGGRITYHCPTTNCPGTIHYHTP